MRALTAKSGTQSFIEVNKLRISKARDRANNSGTNENI
jgi:hypothetical protein